MLIYSFIILSLSLKKNKTTALSSDDEAFQECQSFTSSKGLASNPDSRALTPVNFEQIRVPNTEINATFDSQETPGPESHNKTFDFDSGHNSTETITGTEVEYATEVLEDLGNLNLNLSSETVVPGQILHLRSPLSELTLKEVEQAGTCCIPEIESVKIEATDSVTQTIPEEDKQIVTQTTEASTLEVSGDPKTITEFDPLEHFVNSNLNTTFEQIETNPDLKPENTPLPAEDFDDLSEEDQENIPPVEIKFNSGVTETVAVVVESPVLAENSHSVSGQESTFEGDTVIYLGDKLDLTADKSKVFVQNSFEVKGVSNESKLTAQEFDEIPVKGVAKDQFGVEESVQKDCEPKVVSNTEEIPVKDIINPVNQSTAKDLTNQESFDERPVKGVIHSESLAAFERIEAEINSDSKDFETPLSIEVEAVPAQTAQEKAEFDSEEPTFIVGTMPESKGIPMDVDEDMFEFPPPPPKEMLDEIEQTTACVNKTATSPLNGFGSDAKSEVFVEDFSTVSLDATFKKPSAPAFNSKRRSGDKVPKTLDDEEFQSSAGCKKFYFITFFLHHSHFI